MGTQKNNTPTSTTTKVCSRTCTHLQNPHQNHPFSQLRDARLKMSGRKDLWAEAAALDASGSVGCDCGGAAMSINNQSGNNCMCKANCIHMHTSNING